MSTLSSFAEKLAPILRQKSTIDGQEIEHVYFVSGGFGAGVDHELPEGAGDGTHPTPDGGMGGGGVVIPLGSYYSEGGALRFHVNPIVAMWAAVPLALLGTCTLRGLFHAIGRSKRHRRCNKHAKAHTLAK